MKCFFEKKAIRHLVSAVGAFAILFFIFLGSCSRQSSQGKSAARLQILNIPISLILKNPQGLNLESDDLSGLNLVSTATDLQVSISGCVSGYTSSTVAINSGTVKLYKGDAQCLVKLESFILGSTTYTSTGTNTVAFNTWQAGGVATFRGASDSDLIKVFVGSQVSFTGVLSTDSIVYNFTDISSSTTQNMGSASVSSAIPLSVTGKPSPNFTIVQARVLSTNANGSMNLSFTLQCGNNLSGNSLSTYACDSVLLQSQLDYILITDAYSQGSISVAAANSAFGANTPTAVGNSIITVGSSDSYNNVLPKGGFYTSDSSPLLTGSSAIYPSNLNNVLMLRRKDANGNAESYLYFYVNITSISQTASVSAFGTTYAGGNGTQSNPYLVNTRSGLAAIGAAGSSIFFLQIADINLGGASNPWTTSINLQAKYNGGGHKITGLYQSVNGNAGLFNVINSSSVLSNLTVESVNITLTGTGPNASIGALSASIASGATVSNCSTSGTINITPTSNFGPWVGGLIGTTEGGGSTISSSSSSVNISLSSTGTGIAGWYGGLLGLVNNVGSTTTTTISNSYATGTITVSDSNSGNTGSVLMGGLLGATIGRPVTMTNSYSTVAMTVSPGSFFGNGAAGGLIGQISGATSITGCFAAGSVTYTSTGVGIIAGGIIANVVIVLATVSNSYSMFTVAGGSNVNSKVGGFMGNIAGGGTIDISSSYSAAPSLSSGGAVFGFLGTSTSGVTNSYLYDNANVPSDASSGITSYTTSTDMETQSNFTGLNFTTPIWKMPTANPLSPSGLLSPVLVWQCGRNGITCP